MVKPIKKIQMGKNGLTNEFLMQAKSLFESQRMIKIIVLKSACRNKDELKTIADKIVEFLGKNYKSKIIGYVLTISKFRKKQR